MSRSKLKKGEIIMKKTLNAAARPFYDYDLKGLLAWVVVVIALIALTGCGGGGGGVTGPVPVTPTVTCAGQSAPTVTSPSSCPALSPAPTVTTVGGVLTLSLPPGAQLASASTLTVNAGGTGVVSLAVSAAGVITPAALPCGGTGQLLCSTSYPVTGTLNFTNAPAVTVNTSVMTPAAPAVCNVTTATTYQQLVGPNCVTVNRATNTTTGAPNKVSATNLQLIAATLIGDTQWNADVNAGKVLWFELQNLGGGTPTHIVSWYLRPGITTTTMACNKPIEILSGATPVGQGTSNSCDGNTQDFGVASSSGFINRNLNALNNLWQCGQKNFDLQGNWAGSTFSGSSSVCTP